MDILIKPVCILVFDMTISTKQMVKNKHLIRKYPALSFYDVTTACSRQKL